MSEHIQVVKRMNTRSRPIARYRYSLTSSDHYLNYVRNGHGRRFRTGTLKMLQALKYLRLFPYIGIHEMERASYNLM